MPQDIEEAVKGKSTIKLLLCVALAIGEVSRSDGGVENAIVSVFILDRSLSSHSITENCVSHIGKYTRTISVNDRLNPQ